MVEIYILPLVCLLLNFVAFAACLRFLFSRQGLYWIIPLIVTGFILWPNAMRLYQVASHEGILTPSYTYLDLQPVLLSLFWYAMIVTFHFALKKTVKVNHYEEQVRKNLHEARYQMAVDTRTHALRLQRKKQRYLRQSAVVPALDAYGESWVELFDQN